MSIIGKYRYRLLAYKTICLLPNNWGIILYRYLQNFVGQLRVEKYSKSAINAARKIHELYPNAANAIEIGTGWYPLVPYLLIRDYNYHNIISIDKNEFVSEKTMKETKALLDLSDSQLRRLNYKPNSDLTKEDLREFVSFESPLFFSKATLQHIPPKTIQEIHENMIRCFPRHKVIHFINCNDHRSHTDLTISKYDFLKFSEAEWMRECTQIDYHNRMRLNEYSRMFDQLGYRMIALEYQNPSEQEVEQFIQEVFPKLSHRFQGIDLKNLLAGGIMMNLEYHGE